MIIESLLARNFMRFEQLELNDLPESGIFAVLGENESGKTTIGECIAFALFGETIKTRNTDVIQVINWDAEETQVQLTFHIPNGNGTRYRIERALNRQGRHLAKLVDLDSGVELATNPDAVNDMVRDLAGLDFTEFRRSFYLGQNELDIIRHRGQNNTRQVIYDILGIGILQRAGEKAEEQLDELSRERNIVSRDLHVAEARAQDADVDPSRGERLRLELEAATNNFQVTESRLQEIRTQLQQGRQAIHTIEDVHRCFARIRDALSFERRRSMLRDSVKELEGLRIALEEAETTLDEELDELNRNLATTKEEKEEVAAYREKIRDLQTRIDVYRGRLERLLSDKEGDRDFEFPDSKRVQKSRLEKRNRELLATRKWYLITGVIGILIACLGGASGALILSKELDLGGELVGLTFQTVHITYGAFGIAGIFFLLSVFWFTRASGVGSKAQHAGLAVLDLEEEIENLESEKELLETFDPDSPGEFLQRGAQKLQNAELASQVATVSKSHTHLIEAEQKPAERLKELKPALQKLDDERKAVIDRRSELRRIRNLVERFLSEVPELYRAGEDEEGTDVPEDIDIAELEKDVYFLLEKASESDVQLRALKRDRSEFPDPNTEYDRFRQMLTRIWNYWDPEGEAAETYDEKTRLPELLKTYTERATETVEDILQNEERLLKSSTPAVDVVEEGLELLSEEEQQAEAEFMEARTRKARAAANYDEFQARAGRRKEMEAEVERIRGILRPLETDIRTREVLIKLLDETIEGLKERLGPNLARYISHILPRITGGRYKTVRVSPDLDIRVFSNERNDFVPLTDISVGTCDQILLALRLGISQSLMHARGLHERPQFLFLDEPMASFDDSRSTEFVRLMEEFEEPFVQIFFVSHNTTLSDIYPVKVRTSIDQYRLTVDGSSLRKEEQTRSESEPAPESEPSDPPAPEAEVAASGAGTGTPPPAESDEE